MDLAYQQGDPYLCHLQKSLGSSESDDSDYEQGNHFPSCLPPETEIQKFEPLPEIQVGNLVDFSFDTLFRSLLEKHDIDIGTDPSQRPVWTNDGAVDSAKQNSTASSVPPAVLEVSELENTIKEEYEPNFGNQAQQTDRRRQDQRSSSANEFSLPSRSSTSMRPEETDMETDAPMIARAQAQAPGNRPLGRFGRLVEYQLGILEVQQTGAGSPHNPRNDQRAEIGGPGDRSVGGRRKAKRLRPEVDDYDDSGEAPDRDGPDSDSRKNDTHERLRIACPFMKRFPAEFLTRRTCVGPGFDGMHRMKEHLKRKHFREHTCQRCGSYYDSNRLLQDHLRSPEPCRLREVSTDIGFMTQLQWDDINKKRQGSKTPILERWREIYVIVFPDADESCIPSPYFETAETTDRPTTLIDPKAYETFMMEHLPSRIIMKLTKEFEIMSSEAKERLANIVQEESLGTLKTFVLLKGANSLNDLSNACLPAFDTTSFDDSIFKDVEMYGSGDQFDYSHPFLGEDEWESSRGKEPQPSDSGYGSLL